MASTSGGRDTCRERDRDRERWLLPEAPASLRRPRGVACKVAGVPDTDMKDLTLEARVTGLPAKASFGVGGDARDPVDVGTGGERCGELIWRREKYAGRLARLRERFVFVGETVSSRSDRYWSCSPWKSDPDTDRMSSSMNWAEGALRGTPEPRPPELELDEVRL